MKFFLPSFLFLSLWSAVAISQGDTLSYEFNSAAPIWNNTDDQGKYPQETFQEYYLAFQVSDLAGVGLLKVELFHLSEESKSMIFRKSYPKIDLMTSQYKDGDDIRVSFGNLEKGNYEIFIQLEMNGKKIGQKITKTIQQ